MQKLQDLNPLHDKCGYLSLIAIGIVVLLVGVLLRSDLFLSVVNFVLELLGWIGILGGIVIAAAGVAAHGNERGWWNGLINYSGQSEKRFPMFRGLSSSAVFLLVLIFFFLPWMTISCFDEELATISGADMMGITQVDDIPRGVTDDDYGISDALGSEAALLYVAALLVIAGGVVFFLPEGQGRYVRAGIAGAALLCILAFIFLSLSSTASELGVGIGELGDAGVGISWKIGFWLSLLALILAAIFQFIPMPFADEEKAQVGTEDQSPISPDPSKDNYTPGDG